MSEPNGRKSEAREKLLVAASTLFFQRGFHAVGVDTIVEQSGVTKMTMYKHFPSKDHLIVAILERSDELYWTWFESTIHGIEKPEDQLLALVRAVESRRAQSPESVFCLYQAVAVEFPFPEHMAHQKAVRHKQSIVDRLETMCREASLSEPRQLALQLFVMLEGMCITSRMLGGTGPTAPMSDAALAMVQAHRA